MERFLFFLQENAKEKDWLKHATSENSIVN